MGQIDNSVFSQQKSLLDQQQLQQAFEMQKQLQMAQIQKAQAQAFNGGVDNLPAPLQLANEYQKRIKMGDVEGANLIMQFAKTQDKGLQVGADGQFAPLPGYAPAIANIAGLKKAAEQNAANASDQTFKPTTARMIEDQQNTSKSNFAYPIKKQEELGGSAGKNQAAAQNKLPNSLDQASLALNTIDDALNAQGFDANFGLVGLAPNIPGGNSANAATKIKKVNSQAFLDAFDALRGAGAITETEGQAGTAARINLDKAQSADEARKELTTLKTIINAGVARSRKLAAGAQFTNDPMTMLPNLQPEGQPIPDPQLDRPLNQSRDDRVQIPSKATDYKTKYGLK